MNNEQGSGNCEEFVSINAANAIVANDAEDAGNAA
jgi:hypothetical protein